jgi:hypothetical protein
MRELRFLFAVPETHEPIAKTTSPATHPFRDLAETEVSGAGIDTFR